MVSKSFYPLQVPAQPAEVNFIAWNSPPPNAAMLAFGNLGVSAGKLTAQGWLYDVKNIQSPQVLGKQYSDSASDAAARVMAHKFADEIIFRLGGGIQGIAETQIYFVSDRSGHKEIWAMDYDGSNQHQITRLGSIALAPRISPDGSRLAFSALTNTFENRSAAQNGGLGLLLRRGGLNLMANVALQHSTLRSEQTSPAGAR